MYGCIIFLKSNCVVLPWASLEKEVWLHQKLASFIPLLPAVVTAQLEHLSTSVRLAASERLKTIHKIHTKSQQEAFVLYILSLTVEYDGWDRRCGGKSCRGRRPAGRGLVKNWKKAWWTRPDKEAGAGRKPGSRPGRKCRKPGRRRPCERPCWRLGGRHGERPSGRLGERPGGRP